MRMDHTRKNAYRYLLYWAMLDIRSVAWFHFRWWSPASWRRDIRYMRYAGNLADWLHNLALFASMNFERFDEEWFWNDFESFEERFREFDPVRYRNRFEQRLEELGGKSP